MDPVRNQRPRWRVVTVAAILAAAAAPHGAAGDPGGPDEKALGEQVMRRFCLSCHGAPDGKPEDPLGARLRPEVWGDPERAYEHLGQLWRINRRMDQPFQGTDAERRALAGWLARRAQENRIPAWRAALPWTAAGALLVAAALLFVRARRRGAGFR